MNALQNEERADEKPAQILVVEDEEAIRELLASTLSGAGYDVTTGHKAGEALLRMRMTPYDIILSDYKMPDMDGIAFYKEACASSSDFRARFILITGAVLCPEVLTFLGEHPVRVLPKPFFPSDVVQAVARNTGAAVRRSVTNLRSESAR